MSETGMQRREFLERMTVGAGLGASALYGLGANGAVAEAARRQRRTRIPRPRDLPIDTFVVLMMENRSFDHYLGWVPGADGHQAGLTFRDEAGRRHSTWPIAPDWKGCAHPDNAHGWDAGRVQLDGGRCDGWLLGGSDEFAISYYREHDLPFLPHLAREFTCCDRFFPSLMAGTFPNRAYMHAAQSYGHKDDSLPDPPGFPDTTIWAALKRKGISGRYFFNDLPTSALWGAPGLARSSRVEEFYERAATGTLPAVSFVDPPFGAETAQKLPNESLGLSGDEHPHGDVRVGQAFMSDVVHAFIESPQYRRGALFVLYDEWGGFFDHVRPPRVPDSRASRVLANDFGQMGFRIPNAIVSPYARRGRVAHSTYGYESILKMIEYRYALKPLTRRDSYARNVATAFDWSARPRLEPPHLPRPAHVLTKPCAVSPTGNGPTDGAAGLGKLLHSGYLERLGFDYRPATVDSVFREPSRVRQAGLTGR